MGLGDFEVPLLSSYPLKIFCIGYMLLQAISVAEWITQIGPNLSDTYYIVQWLTIVLKFDTGMVGLLMGTYYTKRSSSD